MNIPNSISSLMMHTLLFILLMGIAADQSAAQGVDPVVLVEPRLTESSGLAFSNRRQAILWTHNDSGSKPGLFALDTAGRKTGEVRFPTLSTAVDWEDMASFVDGNRPRLLVADCGDNTAERESITIYLMDEPDPTKLTSLHAIQTIRVTFPEGAQDCEAVAVDSNRRMIVMVTKSFLPLLNVYAMPLPMADRQNQGSVVDAVATRVVSLALPLITAADFDPDTGDLWLINYFQAFRFVAADRRQSLSEQLAALPVPVELPRLKQIEAAAIDHQGRLWVTSEGSPALLQHVRIPD